MRQPGAASSSTSAARIIAIASPGRPRQGQKNWSRVPERRRDRRGTAAGGSASIDSPSKRGKRPVSAGTYKDLLKSVGFQAFLWTQFLGAFNDNLYKMVVAMVAVSAATNSSGGRAYLSLSGDVFSKRTVLVATKGLEVVAMVLGAFAFLSGRIEPMLGVLFVMALHSTFFSPAKYGILPEMLPDQDLSRGNGLLEMTTFLAIILGTSIGSMMFAAWYDRLGLISLVLIVVAIAGTLASFGIHPVPPSGARKPFRVNPWAEIGIGLRRLYSEKALWLTVLGIAYFWFLGALLQLDIILLGKEVMGLDDFRTGMLSTFLAVGIGLGSLAAGRDRK